jgi:hypothetical protein
MPVTTTSRGDSVVPIQVPTAQDTVVELTEELTRASRCIETEEENEISKPQKMRRLPL